MAKHALQGAVLPNRDGQSAPVWPSYAGTSHLVGTSASGRVTVYVDPTLGDPGLQNAHSLLQDADRVATANDAIFGTAGGNVSVIIFALGGATDGTGGADHGACNFTEGGAIEVCAAFGSPARVSALFEAELSECSMGGNLCGVSTGEALSRWCAAVVGNNALGDFASAPTWVSQGEHNFVDHTDPTDQNPASTGCGMAFISWMMSQGYRLNQIAPAMVSLGTNATFAQLYARLTGQPTSHAWPAFRSAINSLGGASAIVNDDPFGALGATHLARITPETIDVAAKVLSIILADLAAGTPESETVAKVKALVAGASYAVPQRRSSHRLKPLA